MNGNVGYIVTRDGHRVSEQVYNSQHDDELLTEFEHWKSIVDRYNDGTLVSITKVVIR